MALRGSLILFLRDRGEGPYVNCDHSRLSEQETMSTSGYIEEDKSPQSTGFGVTPQCEKCGAPLSVKDTLACRRCGWYASIGAFIEIDKCWEASADPEMEYEP